MRNHYRILSEALEYAVDMGVITSNPVDKVKVPKVKKFKPQIVTPDMAELIMEEAVGTPWLAAICLAFYSGIRRSELCGLRWSDIDFEQYCLAIDRARVVARGGSVEGEPKSESSSRLVSLSTNIVYVLHYHMKDQQRMFEVLGIPWTGDCYLFCNDQGKPYHPSSVSHAFKRFARRAGFPDVRLYDASHAHATIMLKAKVSMKTIQERLGHSKMSTTGDLYLHVPREMDVAAAEAFERQFDKFG